MRGYFPLIQSSSIIDAYDEVKQINSSENQGTIRKGEKERLPVVVLKKRIARRCRWYHGRSTSKVAVSQSVPSSVCPQKSRLQLCQSQGSTDYRISFHISNISLDCNWFGIPVDFKWPKVLTTCIIWEANKLTPTGYKSFSIVFPKSNSKNLEIVLWFLSCMIRAEHVLSST